MQDCLFFLDVGILDEVSCKHKELFRFDVKTKDLYLSKALPFLLNFQYISVAGIALCIYLYLTGIFDLILRSKSILISYPIEICWPINIIITSIQCSGFQLFKIVTCG